MLFKILLWAIVGYIVYSWVQEKFKLKSGGDKTTIHHHHYGGEEKNKKKAEDDYIDYEELN